MLIIASYIRQRAKEEERMDQAGDYNDVPRTDVNDLALNGMETLQVHIHWCAAVFI